MAFWGRVRSGREAARLQYDSVALDTEYAQQSIAALVAKSWFLATEARLQRALAEEMLKSSRQLVGLAGDRLRVGKGDEYDVTLARAGTDTFAGIRPTDVPAFILAQLIGAGAATLLFRWLSPALPAAAPEVVVPRSEGSPSSPGAQGSSPTHGVDV